jgi:Ca2+-transporting ATPase
MAFTTLVFFQLFNIFNKKSPNSSIFFEEIFNNKWLLLAVAVSIMLQVAVIYSPASRFFSTAPLSWLDWLLILAVSSSLIIFNEMYKLAKIRRKK